MATEAAALFVSVDARIAGLERGLARAQTQMQGAARKLGDSADRIENRLGRMGRRMAKGAAIGGAELAVFGVAGALGYAVKKAADMEAQMSSLGAVSKASAGQMAALKKQAMEAGAATKFSALDAAQAQTELAKGGLSVEKILSGGLDASLALAAAGEMDLALAAETTVNAMKMFGVEGDKAMSVADALATAANTTTADVTDFALALKMGGGVAKMAGADLQETVTALEALAEVGIKGSDAGTSLKAFFLNIATPSKKAREAASALGLSIFDAKGELKSLPAVSENLRASFGKLTREQFLNKAGTIAGSDAIRALYALYAAGPEKLAAMEKGLEKQGTAADTAAKKQDNFKGKLENFLGSVETAAITVGEEMLPVLTDAMADLTVQLNEMAANGDLQRFGRDAAEGVGALAAAVPGIVSAIGAIADAVRLGADAYRAFEDASHAAMWGLVESMKPSVLAVLKLIELTVEGFEGLAVAYNALGIGPRADTEALDQLGEKIDAIQSAVKNFGHNSGRIEIEADLDTGKLNAQMRLFSKVLEIDASTKPAEDKVAELRKLPLPDRLQRILGSNKNAKDKIAEVLFALGQIPSSKTVTISVEKKIKQITEVSKILDESGAAGKPIRRRKQKAASDRSLGDALGISTFAGPDIIEMGRKRKPPKLIADTRKGSTKVERHTAAQWRKIRLAEKIAGERAKDRKRNLASTSVFDVRRGKSDLEMAEAEGTPGTTDDLAAIGARETLLGKRLKSVKGKLKGKLSREARARLLGEAASLTGDLTGLGARRGELTAPAAMGAVERMNVAKARLTRDLGDDRAAAEALVGVLRREFDAVNRPGADPAKVEAAADALASASGELDSVAQAMRDAAERAAEEARQRESDSVDAGVALARLTETLADDIAAQQAAAALAQTRLSEAQAAGDMAGIAAFANNLADANQAIKDLTEATAANTAAQQEQIDLLKQKLDDERRARSGENAQSRAMIRALQDQINGNLGHRVGVMSRVPSAGKVGSL